MFRLLDSNSSGQLESSSANNSIVLHSFNIQYIEKGMIRYDMKEEEFNVDSKAE